MGTKAWAASGRALAAGAQVCSLIKSFAFDETTKAIAPLSVHIAEQLGGADYALFDGSWAEWGAA